jgi:hypothetical protein
MSPSWIFGFFSFSNSFPKNHETQKRFLEKIMLFVINVAKINSSVVLKGELPIQEGFH